MVYDPHSQDTTPPGQPSRPVARTSPEYPHDLPAILPGELVAAPRWIVWRYELDADGDAWTKRPVNAKNGKSGAKSTDARTWATLDEAIARYDAGGFDGLMFALGDGFAGVDLDHCIDTETGELGRVESKFLTFDAGAIVERFGTYAEVSPSGEGVHLLMRGELPVGGRKSRNVEMYNTSRFLSITGARIDDVGDGELVEATEMLAALHREVFFDEAAQHRAESPRVAHGTGPVFTDETIIHKASNARNAPKFLALWNGDRSGYASGNEGDLALIGVLAFYSSDADQLDRLFRQSGLMREKWERDDYRERTIRKVLDDPARPMWTPASERDGVGSRPRTPPAAEAVTSGPVPALRKVYPFTEFGNTDRMLDTFGADMRYNKALGFVAWDGKRWRIDAEIQVRELASKTVRALYDEAAEVAREAQTLAHAGDDEGAKQTGRRAASILDWARKSSTDHMVKAMTTLIQPEIYAPPDIFDTHPMLFNCANGTIDLTTGELRPHDRADYLTQCSPVEYHPDAQAPTFLRFLGEIMLDRDELVDYLQRAFGYSISGDVSAQVWHLLIGEGSNGKTTLIEALEYVIGDYAATMEPESITITGQRRDAAAPSPDIAKLKGVRFTKITETEEGARIAPARIKKLSGGDELSARYLNKNIFEFHPTHKLWLYTNHRPEARETTHAFWRRVRYVPFDMNLRDHPERKDETLPQKLRAEAEGILAWLVRGALRWQSDGLAAPALMTDAAEGYRADMDVLAAFLRDCCKVGPEFEVRATPLYEEYKRWSEENGERPRTQRKFGQALNERGFGTRMNNGTVRLGLRLLDTWEEPDPTEPTEPSRRPTEPSREQRFRDASPESKPVIDTSEETTEPSEPIFQVQSHAYAPRGDLSKKGSEGSVGSVGTVASLTSGRLADAPLDPVEPLPGVTGEGYSMTPNRDEPCPKGGRHMWMTALEGRGMACKKCRPELVNRPK